MGSTEHHRTCSYVSGCARMSKETSLAAGRISASVCNAGVDKRASTDFGSCEVSETFRGVLRALGPAALAAAVQVAVHHSPGQRLPCRAQETEGITVLHLY